MTTRNSSPRSSPTTTDAETTPDALDYLQKRGITNPGHRPLSHRLLRPQPRLEIAGQATEGGAALRTRLQQVGLFRESGHEHFRGSITFPILLLMAPARSWTSTVVKSCDTFAKARPSIRT